MSGLLQPRNAGKAFVIASLLFSVIGMRLTGMDWGRVSALLFVHAVAVWLLSETLAVVLAEWSLNRAKAVTATALGLAFFCFDVWITHYGVQWLFSEWPEIAVFGASFALSVCIVAGDWAFTPSPRAEDEEDASQLAENVTRLRNRIGG